MFCSIAAAGIWYYVNIRPYSAELCAGIYDEVCQSENLRFFDHIRVADGKPINLNLRLSVAPEGLLDSCALEIELTADTFELPIDKNCEDRAFIAFPIGFTEDLPYDARGAGREYHVVGKFIARYREQYGFGPISYPKYLLEPE